MAPQWPIGQHRGMNERERRPIADVLPGFALHPLDDGWTPLQAWVLVKSLDNEGSTAWSFRTSEQINPEELLGALTVQVEVLRRRLADEWDEYEDEDDD
jgi:hypothetical protein